VCHLIDNIFLLSAHISICDSVAHELNNVKRANMYGRFDFKSFWLISLETVVKGLSYRSVYFKVLKIFDNVIYMTLALETYYCVQSSS